MKRFHVCVSLLGLLVALNIAAFPQTSSSSLRGTVTDPTGSAITGATVVIANEDSQVSRSVTTGEAGDYRFLSLPPGTYTLIVTATGFARYEQTGLRLLVDTPATANVEMKIRRATESVTVSSETPALNLVDASLGNSFDQTQVRQIPLEGRNVPDLLSLQAGVAYTGNRPDIDHDQDTRSGSVNGARSDQSNVTLDGVDVNDQSHGYAFTSVLPATLDSVQEFRVTTSNYNADQGIGSGAQVSPFLTCPFEALAAGRISGYLFPSLNRIELYHLGGYPVYLPHVILGLGLTVGLTWLNYRCIQGSARLSKTTTFTFLVLVIVFALAGASRGSASNFHPWFSHAPLLSVLLVWQLVPWLTAGFESVGKCAEEASPDFGGRDFSVAILLTILLGLVFFWLVIASVSFVAP